MELIWLVTLAVLIIISDCNRKQEYIRGMCRNERLGNTMAIIPVFQRAFVNSKSVGSGSLKSP